MARITLEDFEKAINDIKCIPKQLRAHDYTAIFYDDFSGYVGYETYDGERCTVFSFNTLEEFIEGMQQHIPNIPKEETYY